MIISSTGGRRHQLGEFECPTNPLYTDTFDRSNGAIGADWTNRAGTYSISSNEAYPSTTGTNCYVTYDQTPMPADDMAVGIVLGSKVGTLTDSVRILLGCNTSGYGRVLSVLATADTMSIYSFESWAIVSELDLISVSLATGDEIIFARWGSIYTAFLNGTQLTDLVVDDNTNIDSSHRLAGMGAFSNATSGNYRRINTWNAYDLS